MKKLTTAFIRSFLIVFLLPFISAGVQAQQHVTVSAYANQGELTAQTSITFTNGFTVPAGADFKAYISTGAGAPLNTQIDTNWNTVVAYTMRVPGIVDPADPQNGVEQVNVVVQTMDHFGRVIETNNVKASPGFKDVRQMVKYDAAGRETRKYQPFISLNATVPGRYMGGNYTDVYNYYTTGTHTPSIAGTAYPYSETVFDDSPLNRVLESSAPGTNNGRTVKTALLMGQGDVAKYTVQVNKTTGARKLLRAGNNAVYNGLDVSIGSIKNENVTGLDGTVHEYKNREGQVLLKRIFNKVGAATETLSTYYVYDEMNNLSFVLPPKANPDNSAAIDTGTLNNLCYQYRYDGLQRLVAKRVPGKGWEYLVYNKLGQVVMAQDSVQRKKAPQEWVITKYDASGRPAITGIYVHTGSTSGTNYLSNMQASVNLQGAQWESRITTGNGYTNVTFPKTWTTTLSVNYYDDYNFPGGNPYPYAAGSGMSRGLPTGSKVNVLGSANMLWNVNYYDTDGRAVKTFKQHYKGGTLLATNYDEVTNTYGFTGALLTSARSHKAGGTEQAMVLTEYDYDHMGRKTGTWKTINTGPVTLLSKMVYDDLGQVWKKNLHSINSGTSFLQTTEYKYNPRGWLLSASAPKLDIKLRYESPEKGATAQYNGNISEMEYTGERSGNRWFKYTYDNLDRLTASVYSTASELDETMVYDKMGNITSLKRGPAAGAAIVYAYAAGSNRLTGVTGGRTGTFTYDGNGSAITDGTRGVSLTYNLLNLPATVTGEQTASYTYDASGSKLRSVQGTVARDYIGGLQYKNNVLEFIATEEGRAVRNPADGTYRYEYTLKDHLGNARVSIDDNAGVARVVQEDEYHAFGLSRPKYLLGDKNNYLYNGKEKQDGLADVYDYGARFYDALIGRFTTIDPSADEADQESDTPYGYVANNPISRDDPDGKVWNLVIGAAIGAAVDIALQSAEIAMDDDKSFSKDFSYKSVAVSAIAGATGVGLASKIGKLGTVAKIGIELAHDAAAGAANQYATEGKVDVKSTLVNAVGGKVAGDIAGKVIGKQIAKSPQAKYLARQADRANRVAGDNPVRPTRAAAASAATKKAANYGNARAVAAGAASSGAASKVVSTVVDDDKKKKK